MPGAVFALSTAVGCGTSRSPQREDRQEQLDGDQQRPTRGW
ncbi:hypothetical protein [Saccharopolyspora sp. NPDC049426]